MLKLNEKCKEGAFATPRIFTFEIQEKKDICKLHVQVLKIIGTWYLMKTRGGGDPPF